MVFRMMARIFWFVIGTLAGVYAVTRLRRQLAPLTPPGLQRNLERAQNSAASFAERVRTGMVARESELNDALGLREDASDRR